MDETKPRYSCEHYFFKRGIVPVAVPKKEFDVLMNEPGFVDGPFVETFGDGYGEPYNPNRQAFGELKDGRGVFCELR